MDPLRKHNTSAATVAVEPMHTEANPTEAANSAGPNVKALPRVQFNPTIYTNHMKPAGDSLAALCALVILAIPMLLIAVAVALSMGRPVFFRQRRVGLNGEIFEVLKFRTMGIDRRSEKINVIHDNRLTHKSDHDPRHTPLGRILRNLSLDELPQLINILRGEMSIVGPRPELESVVANKYPENLDQRHQVRPGLTGMWQISARGSGPMHENGKWDLEYIERISFLTDVKIVCKTPFAMFGGKRGA